MSETSNTIGGEKDHLNPEYEYLSESKSQRLDGIHIQSVIEEKKHYALGVHYPVTMNSKVNQVILEHVKTVLTEFHSDVADLFGSPPPPGGYPNWKMQLFHDYKVFRLSGNVVSFKFEINSYTGGAHSIREIVTMTFNLETGEQYSLSDFFRQGVNPLVILSELAFDQLATSDRLPDESWIKDGVAAEDGNYKRFVLTKDALVLFYPPYQVGPWSAGDQQVTILLKDLRGIISPQVLAEAGKAEEPNLPSVPVPLPPTIDDNSPLVALTFDDGPHPRFTSMILDELEKRNAVATFFVLGNRAEYYPDLLRRIVAEGSEIGNHSWNHMDFSRLSPEAIKKQIADTNEVIYRLTGVTPRLVRPPYGATGSVVRDVVRLPLVLWSVDPQDWKDRDKDTIIARITTRTKNGDIVLQHDIYESTAESIGPILDDLLAKGFRFVTVSQLLDLDKDAEYVQGKVYSRK